VVGGTIVAVGGFDASGANSARVDAYSIPDDRWRRLPDLPSARGGTGAAAVAGRIVSVGGESPQGTDRAVWALRPGTRRWLRLPDLPTPRHGLGVVGLGGRVWVVAGGPEPGLTVSGAVESLPVSKR
jgi:N-acetylneuraminic acid mutarotase